jgi:hypothetical protein
MDTAIGSSGKEESSFTPIGEKTQSQAGSDEFPFNGSVYRLHLRAKKPAAKIGYPERQPHRSCTRRVNRLIFLQVLFSDWRV